MRVRQQDVLNVEIVIANGGQQLVDFVARIDDDRLARPLAADDEAVLVERRRPRGLRGSFTTILNMILCVVDDLLFSVKISTAAKGLGADVYFERRPSMVVRRGSARRQPSLVIFDLNSAKLDPIGVIAALKADPLTRDDPDARLRVSRADGHDRRGPSGRHRRGAGALGVFRSIRRNLEIVGRWCRAAPFGPA